MSFKDFFSFSKHSNLDKENRTLFVNKNRCPQNHRCPSIQVCPVKALSQKGFAAPTVDLNKCTGCGKCTRYCFPRALVLQKQG